MKLPLIKTIAFAMIIIASQPALAQEADEYSLSAAIKNVQTNYLNEIKKDAKGVYTFKCEKRERFRGYNSQLYEYSQPFKGMKNRPTATVTYRVSPQAITITLYDDVQYACDFDENGSPAAPDDPYTSSIGCKSGTRDVTGYLITPKGYVKASTKYICQHTKKQYKPIYGNRGRDPYTGQIIPETRPNPYAPWLFTHTITITFPFDAMAKACDMTRSEFLQFLLKYSIDTVSLVPNERGRLYYLDAKQQDCLAYCLWKVSGLNMEDVK